MTDKISELLDAAAARTVPVVHKIGDAQLRAATPCADYQVKDLLNHLFLVMVNFRALAAKEESDFSTTPDRLSGDWRADFAADAARLVEAWGAPGAEEGETGAMRMPARTVGGLVLLDLTVHGWDLARATGQDFTPDGRAVAWLTPLVAKQAPIARQMGMFGEPVPVGEGATDFEKLLAETGRDPG
ncbi:TIGR03086 family protein [Streptomyces sp. N2-109]|uniref:TIGR03086 family protein n=1 Tax=Streptomyces gossypii TaxID=2883101 RepID=A0ABT2K1F5_9ACTN|nr:TIGR03086 family metal-binding protein [Streptomyces gossypii]MCT2593997.1 TIGR03086 family protein [Streptomyces gossypii]